MYKDDVSIYIDMDGTLVEYEEEYLKRGIYENAIPHDEIVKLARLLNLEGYDIWFLTSIPDGENWIKEEKLRWLYKHNLSIEDGYKILMPKYSLKKCEVAHERNPRTLSILIDDFSKNLFDWENFSSNENKFRGIKCNNNINGTKGSWSSYGGYSISAFDCSLYLMADIEKFIYATMKEEV